MIRLPSSLIAPTTLSYLLFSIAIVGGVLALISACMIIRGIVKKKSKRYFAAWLITFLITAVLAFLVLTGQFVKVI